MNGIDGAGLGIAKGLGGERRKRGGERFETGDGDRGVIGVDDKNIFSILKW